MTRLLFSIFALFTVLMFTNCEKSPYAEAYLYQAWITTKITKNGVDNTLDCDKKSWIKLYSTGYYDAHDGCGSLSMSNVPFTYNKKDNSITLSTISNTPFIIVQLEEQTLVIEQRIGEDTQRREFKKM